jgi:hypothetical protein
MKGNHQNGYKRKIIVGRRKGSRIKKNSKAFEVEIFAMQQWCIDLQKKMNKLFTLQGI